MITRTCLDCGAELEVAVSEDNTYDGGHFFGMIPDPDGGEVEYWECDDCAGKGDGDRGDRPG